MKKMKKKEKSGAEQGRRGAPAVLYKLPIKVLESINGTDLKSNHQMSPNWLGHFMEEKRKLPNPYYNLEWYSQLSHI